MLLHVALLASIGGFVLIFIWKAILFIIDNFSSLRNSRLAFNNKTQQPVQVLKCKGQGQEEASVNCSSHPTFLPKVLSELTSSVDAEHMPKKIKGTWFVSKLHKIKHPAPPGSCAWLFWPSPVLALALPPHSSSEKFCQAAKSKCQLYCDKCPKMDESRSTAKKIPFHSLPLMVKVVGGLINESPFSFPKVHTQALRQTEPYLNQSPPWL